MLTTKADTAGWKRSALLLLLLFFVAVSALRASSPEKSLSGTISSDFSLFTKLAGHTFTAPLRWDGTDWLLAGGLWTGSAASGLLDERMLAAVDRSQNRGNDRLEEIFEAYSNGLSGIGFAGVFYTTGLVFDNEWLRVTGVLLGTSLMVSAVTQTSLKYIFGRARPYTRLPASDFRPFSFDPDFVSFPSGHTLVAFTISAVLAERIGNVWASIGLYSAATLGGLSRVYSRNHWLSDVVFGAGMAVFVSRSVVSYYENGMNDNGDGSGFRIMPHGTGLTVTWRF